MKTITPDADAYFVATVTRYVIVNAKEEADACELAKPMLHELYADIRERLGREVPINIHTVRPATNEEITQWNWHWEMVAKEMAANTAS